MWCGRVQAHDTTTAMKFKQTLIQWRLFAELLILIPFGLGFLIGLFMPGSQFFQGKTRGVFWLFIHARDISYILALFTIVCATVGLIAAISPGVFERDSSNIIDIVLAIVNGLVITLQLCLIFLFNQSIPIFSHMESISTQSHVYHYEYCMSSSGGSGCTFDSDPEPCCLKSRYFVVECDQYSISCQQVFATRLYELADSQRPRMERESRTNIVKVIEPNGTVLWENSEP
jgi:hypothetical protein